MAQVSVGQFRANFGEFANVANYPDGLITFWMNFAYSMLNACRWGAQLDMAAQLYAAHNIVIERRAILDSMKGNVPGQATGALSARSVDKASVSYDTAVAALEGAGDWNLTIYGQRLYRMILIFGMGPVVVGVGVQPWFIAGAWPGPIPWPGWFGN